MKRAAAGLVALLVLAGCGAGQASSEERFEGAKREVAAQVEELQAAGNADEPEKICAEILSRTLVTDLEAAGTSCTEEMDKAIQDADDFELDVRNVTIQGNEATVQVRRGEDGPTETFEFVRENGQWRATSFNAG
jgi:hypothetical protein